MLRRTTFFQMYCNEKQFQKLEVNKKSAYLALAEKNLDGCLLLEKKLSG